MLLGELQSLSDIYVCLNSVADIADYYEPTMLIVGSRGLGQLSG